MKLSFKSYTFLLSAVVASTSYYVNGQPANDSCDNAEVVTMPATVSSSTVDATIEYVDEDAPGVWYTVTGSGNPIQAKTCNGNTSYDSWIHVYSGTACTGLTLVDQNDDGCPDFDTSTSTVTWETSVGGTYYILVHGYDGDTGPFDLTIQEVTASSNDSCSAATVLDSGTVQDNTLFATYEQDQIDVPSCSTLLEGPGVWYTANGSGNAMRAHTCNSYTSFDTVISVFDGTDCSSLSCVQENEDACENFSKGSSVTWESNAGTTYYVFVHGDEAERGNYELTIEDDTTLPDNDDCTGATALTLGTSITGSMEIVTYASDAAVVPTCARSEWPGLWYTVTGTGNKINANTCSDTTDFDTVISVFSGTECTNTNLQCVGENEDGCGNNEGSSVTWDSTPGTQYYIYVHGDDKEQGVFELSVEETTTPSDDCILAQSVNVGDTILADSTGATYPQDDTDIPESDCRWGGDRPGVWYRIAGTGNPIRVHTCNDMTFIDTLISVFQGSLDCSNLVCVDTNDDGCSGYASSSSVTWESTVGVDYFIVVQDYDAGTGLFQLEIESPTIPSNDHCTGATTISVPSQTPGSLFLATLEQDIFAFGVCTALEDNPGVWYTIQGDDSAMQVDTCTTDFDTVIGVFVGDSCGQLSCVATDDTGCHGTTSEGSLVTWQSVAGETYYVFVQGFGDELGDFSLALRQVVLPENDDCPNALTLLAGETVTGSTQDASLEEGIGSSTQQEPGVWYYIDGTGNPLTASTCSSNTNFDTIIQIYEGDDCNVATFLVEDDDGCADPSVASVVTWNSVQGEKYFIFVEGIERGDFELSITEDCGTDCGGDPHFGGWNGNRFQYHGECDLVVLHNAKFASGLGCDAHIRMTRDNHYSFINELALRIGQDVLEVHSLGEFKVNGVVQDMTNTTEATFSGYPFSHWHSGKVDFHRYYIDLGKTGEKLDIKCFENMINLEVKGGASNMFKDSVGFLGDSNSGDWIGRDGTTRFHSAEEFAIEWQVRDTDVHLFQYDRFPQWPEPCLPANKFIPRLGLQVAREEAEKLCDEKLWGNKREECIFDVVATRNIDVAGFKEVEADAFAVEDEHRHEQQGQGDTIKTKVGNKQRKKELYTTSIL